MGDKGDSDLVSGKRDKKKTNSRSGELGLLSCIRFFTCDTFSFTLQVLSLSSRAILLQKATRQEEDVKRERETDHLDEDADVFVELNLVL